MKMVKIYGNYKARMKECVRNQCEKLTFKQRCILIAIMVLMFLSLSLCVLCSAVYQIGKQDKEKELHINSASYFINQDYNYGK